MKIMTYAFLALVLLACQEPNRSRKSPAAEEQPAPDQDDHEEEAEADAQETDKAK